jgi:hypothetical protein
MGAATGARQARRRYWPPGDVARSENEPRITVWGVLSWLAAGMTDRQILDDYPELGPLRGLNRRMANDEQWIALGKLLAAHSLLRSNVTVALFRLLGGDAGPEPIGVLMGYLNPTDQALAALRLWEERSKNGNFSAKAFHELRGSLAKALDLSTSDFRVFGLNFDLVLYLDRKTEAWSCLNVTLEAEELDRMASECFEAAISLQAALFCLISDEERSSSADESDPSAQVGVSSVCMVCGQSMTMEHSGGWCTCPVCKQPFGPDHCCKPADVPASDIPS